MPAPDPAKARKHLVDVVGSSVSRAMRLRESLAWERSALEAEDLQALEDAVAAKSRWVNELAALDAKRAGLCAQAGFAAGPDQMRSAMAWCDEASVLANAWDELMAVAAECNALNMTNGAIIRLREQHLRSSLSILRGQPRATDTYGRPGRENMGFDQRSLAEA